MIHPRIAALQRVLHMHTEFILPPVMADAFEGNLEYDERPNKMVTSFARSIGNGDSLILSWGVEIENDEYRSFIELNAFTYPPDIGGGRLPDKDSIRICFGTKLFGDEINIGSYRPGKHMIWTVERDTDGLARPLRNFWWIGASSPGPHVLPGPPVEMIAQLAKLYHDFPSYSPAPTGTAVR